MLEIPYPRVGDQRFAPAVEELIQQRQVRPVYSTSATGSGRNDRFGKEVRRKPKVTH